MLGWILGGLCVKGANSLYKDAKYHAQVQAAGHWSLVNCKTVDEIIYNKCLFMGEPSMPKLTESEIKRIEHDYRELGTVCPTIRNGYYKATGNSLIDVKRR